MAHVNLLPWRAERRKLREREFYGQLGAAFVAGLGFVLLWAIWMGARVDNQNDRNAILQGEIKQLDVKIAKIKELDKVREWLTDHALFTSNEFPVESFCLYSSKLTSDGSIYRIEQEYPLRGFDGAHE